MRMGAILNSKASRGHKTLCLLIFTALYSNVLKLWLGSWATLVYDILLVFALIMLANYRWNPKGIKSVAILFISALLLIIMGLFEMVNLNISNHLYSLIEFRKTLFQIIVLFVAYAYCDDSGDGEACLNIIRFIVLASLPLVIYGIKQFFYFDSIDARLYSLMDSAADTNRYGSTTRAMSFFSGPFHYGMFCVLNTALSLFLARKARDWKCYIITVVCLVGVFCSYTRTNMACAIFAIATFFVIPSVEDTVSGKVSHVRMAFSCLIVVPAVIFAISSPGYIDFGNAQLNILINGILNAGQDTRLLNRFETWEQAIGLISMHPLTGNGIGAAGDTLGNYGVALNWVTPHNAFIKVAVELGLVGAIVFVIFILASLAVCFRLVKVEGELLPLSISIAFAVLVNMMLGSTLGTFPVMSLVYVLIGLACKRVEKLSEVQTTGSRKW